MLSPEPRSRSIHPCVCELWTRPINRMRGSPGLSSASKERVGAAHDLTNASRIEHPLRPELGHEEEPGSRPAFLPRLEPGHEPVHLPPVEPAAPLDSFRR